jgi:quercetin dioxygenase-like cupin family protein/DNA-binding XRE family transcriptional regulator
MLSKTLVAGLERYKIGPKLRDLRLKKKLGLVELGEHTSLSPALLSKIERGRLFPTLPTLLRIALVFGVGLDHFFADTDAKRSAAAVTRKKDRLRLPDKPDAAFPAFFFESLDYPATERRIDAYRAEFPPQAATTEPHRHEGTEFVYVLEGQLAVTIEGEDYVLGQGDAMHFDAGAPHAYRAHGRAPAAAIFVIAPKEPLVARR